MRIFLTLFAILYCTAVSGQDSTLYYYGSLQTTLSTAQTPFWLRANQYGSIPSDGSFVSVTGGFYKVYNGSNPRIFQWSGGVEFVGNVSKSSALFLRDAFIAGKAGPFELSIGQRKEFSGLTDSLLSTGPFALSTNFRPYPKLQISTPHFTNIIPGNDLLAFKFTYSDGLLGPAQVHYGNTNKVPDVYLHQKSLYIRIGRNQQKLNFYAGFNHQAMWGGEEKIFSGGLKPSLAYKYVIFGKLWAQSRVGNHFGTIDLAAEWKGKKWATLVYRQNIYDDGSLSNLSNIADGLNGIRFKRKRVDLPSSAFQINTVLLEYLYTKSQGGNVFDFATKTFGRDDYFNHYVYDQGWSYKGQSLGSPLLGPQELNREEIQGDSTAFTMNNRVLAFHLGLTATWRQTNILFKGTVSHNEGSYPHPFKTPIVQSSIFLQADRKITSKGNQHLSVSLAGDFGKLYPINMALMLGWKTTGFLR